jgi:hypothetical protein
LKTSRIDARAPVTSLERGRIASASKSVLRTPRPLRLCSISTLVPDGLPTWTSSGEIGTPGLFCWANVLRAFLVRPENSCGVRWRLTWA